jgi:cystinosin
MYPQVILNYRRASVNGLNFDYVLLNIIGHSSYMIYNLGLYYSETVQQEYFKIHKNGVNPVRLNDVFFSCHATLLTAVTIWQCFIYDSGGQKVSKIGKFASYSLIIYLILMGLTTYYGITNVLGLIYAFSYVKLIVTLFKYFPQAYMNFIRKSTVGWSILNVLLDFIGGTLSLIQMILLALFSNDYSSIWGSPTKLGLGILSIFYDLIFIYQHYFLYNKL